MAAPWMPLSRSWSGSQSFMRDDGETLQILKVQDLTPVIEQNKADMSMSGEFKPNPDLQRKAFIPDMLIAKWLNEEGIDVWNPDHWSAVKRKLNSNEYAYLRTAPGRI